MKIQRRNLLCAAAGLAAVPVSGLFAQTGPAPSAPAGSDERRAAAERRLLEALHRNRLPLRMDGGRPSGAGWDFLLGEAAAARFTLLGEEHGVAETALLAGALFDALGPAGYDTLAVELSPTVARDMAAAARRGGVSGLRRFMAESGVAGAVYGWREEMEFLVRSAAPGPGRERRLWGFDREIFNDRYLIANLAPRVPRSARPAFERLQAASNASWAAFSNSPNPDPDDMFSLSGDPALVEAVRAAWPRPDAESAIILETLEETLVIGALSHRRVFEYTERRGAFNRANFLRELQGARSRRGLPKVMLKFGYNHMIRGANYFNVFDVGAIAPDIAALEGGRSFHVIVLPGPGSYQAVPGANFAPVAIATDGFDEFRSGEGRLTRVLPSASQAGHEVVDLRALRPLAARGLEASNPDLVRTIHGYDAALIWHRGHASTAWD